jgi:signal transduction histidine kinase
VPRLRTIAGALGLALILILVPAAIAGADFRGSDLWDNIAPSSGVGGLVDRYPISNYQLDYHVSGGIISVANGDVVLMVFQFVGSFWFLLLAWLMRMVVTAFNWAFTTDFIGGPNGMIGPIGLATQRLWSTTIAPFFEVALILFGLWIIASGFRHKNAEAGAGVTRTIIMTVCALAIVHQPGATIGRANELVRQLSSSVAAGSAGGGSASVSDRIFTTFVYRPWVVLQFSSADKICVGTRTDSDGYPLSWKPGYGPKTCHSVQHRDPDKHGGYSDRFIALPFGSKARNAEYEALRDGKAPDGSPKIEDCPRGDCSATQDDRSRIHDQFGPDYQVDKTDAPAVDMMQAGGTGQRMVGLFVLTIGIVAAIFLLGLLAFAALFANLAVMILLALTPLIVIAAIVPWWHGIVTRWARLLGQMLVSVFFYAVMLGIVSTVSDAAVIVGAGTTAGFLYTFIVPTVLFAGLLVWRKQLSSLAFGAASQHHEQAGSSAKSFTVAAAGTAAGAVVSPVATMRKGWSGGHEQHESSEEKTKQHTNSDSNAPAPDSSSPPASAGREYSPPGQTSAGAVPSASNGTVNSQESPDESQPESPEGEKSMPTNSFREDLEAARARQTQTEQQAPAEDRQERQPLHASGISRPDNLGLEIDYARLQRERVQREAEFER